jgi:hypothetical protein
VSTAWAVEAQNKIATAVASQTTPFLMLNLQKRK